MMVVALYNLLYFSWEILPMKISVSRRKQARGWDWVKV